MDIQRIRLFREKLRQLEREVNDPFRSENGCCGISLAQCHTLLEVGNKGRVSLVELASILGLDASTLSRTIQGLVMLGFVSRTPGENDRRYVSISLTEKGREIYDDIETKFNDYYARVIDLIPADKQSAAVDGVAALADALKSYNHSASCRAAEERRSGDEKE